MLALEIDRSGAVPIYMQLRNWMEQRILNDDWPAGTKLKAEAELAEEMELARGTVRKAIEELSAAGLLIRTHGRGTYVAPRPVEQPLAQRLVTHSEALLAQGIDFETRVLDCSVIAASALVASHLQLPAGAPVLRLARVRTTDEGAIILLHNYVVHRLCPGIERCDFTRLRLFQVLEEQYQLLLASAHRTFQAQAAEQAVADALSLEAGDAVMHMMQTTFLPDGTPIEMSSIWLRGDRFRLSADVERGKQPPIGLTWIQPGAQTPGSTVAPSLS
ncbi:MAG: GntR family transcriptional regulator [Caldilineaceae bacterium]